MLKSNLNYINTILENKYKNNVKIYFIFSILIALLETIGVGIIPGVLAFLLDKNIILEKLKFNEDLYIFMFDLLKSDNLFILTAVTIFVFFLTKVIINLVFIVFESKLFNNIKINLSSSMFEIYLKKNYLFHSSNNPIILGRNISSEVNSTVSYIKSLILLIKEIVQVLLIGLLLLFASFKVSILIFFLLFFIGLIYFKIVANPFREKVKVAFYERGEKSKIINQILNSIIEIKLYRKASFFIKKFNESISREFKSLVFYEIITKVPRQIIELLIISLMSFVIFYLPKVGINIEAVISVILLYFFAALRIYPSINNIINSRLGLLQNEISIKTVYENIKNKNDSTEDIHEDYKKFEFKNNIQIKNLSFNYPERNQILKNIDLAISKNEIIGIVGKTGSGKSTLLKIIMGLIKHTGGNITIDGIRIEDIKNEWQNNFAYIPQNYYILDDTVLNNIVFGEDEDKINHELLNRSIKFASLNNFIDQLPNKLKTIVGPNGKKISGGQAQRLAIARAIYRDPGIIVLDEATNSLDDKTEMEILDKIYKLKGKKTILIITHNKKILDDCDKIYNIENGYLK